VNKPPSHNSAIAEIMDISPVIRDLAPAILAEITTARSVLLHCHPGPDPDSVGSALAMKFALQLLGKHVIVIAGDSPIPAAFAQFPGAKEIVPKNFGEIDQNEFDLFVALDSSTPNMVSKKCDVKFLAGLKVVVIDHHVSNLKYGAINLVEPSYPATAQILYDLFHQWKVAITPDISANLFLGMYTDTGGFQYSSVTPHTFEIAADLARIFPGFSKLIEYMDGQETPAYVDFMGLGLSSIRLELRGRLAISTVSHAQLMAKHIGENDVGPSDVSSFMRAVKDWTVTCSAVELSPGTTRFSFRSKDVAKYDVAALVTPLGGGGHKAASGLTLNLPLNQAVAKVVQAATDMFIL
jgi:phosphoesterase RecJ-like protein